jgi:hypothetical protein
VKIPNGELLFGAEVSTVKFVGSPVMAALGEEKLKENASLLPLRAKISLGAKVTVNAKSVPALAFVSYRAVRARAATTASA